MNIDINKINSIGLGYGELVLKGKNRKVFEENIKNKLLNKLEGSNTVLKKDINKVYIYFDEGSCIEVFNKIKKVFGINNITLNICIENDLDKIKEKVLEIANELYEKGARNFKVNVKRSNKNVPVRSMDFSRELGAHILINSQFTSVKMNNPDCIINVDIREKTYIYTEKRKMYGGMPLGSAGRGLSLISGGIDSPVASFLMAKRGLRLNFATFHSFPFTSQMAIEKVKDLVKVLKDYNGKSVLYTFNILEAQEEFKSKTKEGYSTILVRRFMMRLSEMLCKRKNMQALVTGESLGQVASQTIGGLTCTNAAVEIPVFRPLIGMDKTEITEIAEEIGTYEISIKPYMDSCEMFAPKHPVTNPTLDKIIEEERKIENYNELLEKIYNNKEEFVF